MFIVIGDSLAYQNGAKFSTNDRDYDTAEHRSCAESFGGAWWYYDCLDSNLNERYRNTGPGSYNGLIWYH